MSKLCHMQYVITKTIWNYKSHHYCNDYIFTACTLAQKCKSERISTENYVRTMHHNKYYSKLHILIEFETETISEQPSLIGLKQRVKFTKSVQHYKNCTIHSSQVLKTKH